MTLERSHAELMTMLLAAATLVESLEDDAKTKRAAAKMRRVVEKARRVRARLGLIGGDGRA